MAEKRKRLFNGFDVAIVLLVIAAAFVWFFVINRAPEVEEASFDGKAIYFIEVPDLTLLQIAAVEIGDAVLEGARHLPIGHVAAVERRPHELRVDCEETQTISWDIVPGRYTMVVTVETEVVETPSAILAEGEFAIRGGAPISFTGPGFAFTNAWVLGWERGEQ